MIWRPVLLGHLQVSDCVNKAGTSLIWLYRWAIQIQEMFFFHTIPYLKDQIVYNRYVWEQGLLDYVWNRYLADQSFINTHLVPKLSRVWPWHLYIHMMTSSNGNIFRVTGHLSPVNSPRKGQWRGALMFTLICAGINGWVNNREAGDLRRNRGLYDVTVMQYTCGSCTVWIICQQLGNKQYSIYSS